MMIMIVIIIMRMDSNDVNENDDAYDDKEYDDHDNNIHGNVTIII